MKKPSRRVHIVDPAIWSESLNHNVDWKLLLGCTFHCVPIAREALFQNADVNCRRADYLTPLHIAVTHNDTELIQLLCDQPFIDIEARTLDGLTPLHKATFLGYINATEKLIQKGANVNCIDNLGRYPLHYTTLRQDLETATLLLTNGARVNVYDAFHESPLYTSVILRPFIPMIKLLLSHGASVSSAPEHTSLGLLLEAALYSQNTSDLKIFDLLLRNEADVNTTDFIGLRTPLHIVAMTGNINLATYFIKKGADLNRKNKGGHTPKDVALMYRHFQIAEVIENAIEKELKEQKTSTSNFTKH